MWLTSHKFEQFHGCSYVIKWLLFHSIQHGLVAFQVHLRAIEIIFVNIQSSLIHWFTLVPIKKVESLKKGAQMYREVHMCKKRSELCKIEMWNRKSMYDSNFLKECQCALKSKKET